MFADLAVGTGMKITCSRDELASRLASSHAGSRHEEPCRSWPACFSRREAAPGVGRDGYGALVCVPWLDAKWKGKVRRVVPGRLLDGPRAPAARGGGRARASRRGEHGLRVQRLVRVPAAYVRGGGLSSASRSFAGSALDSATRSLLLETITRVSRAAGRDESRPVLTGILVRFEESQA